LRREDALPGQFPPNGAPGTGRRNEHKRVSQIDRLTRPARE
jgi:hypothetical protein